MDLGRKISSGKYHSRRKKKLYERRNQERIALLAETKKKNIRTRGGNTKTILLGTNLVNLTINGKTKKARIINVIETPQNQFFARQNRLMRGAIIETDQGKAMITNRPSQEGHINAVVIKEK